MFSLRAWIASVLFAFAFFFCFVITIYVCFGSTFGTLVPFVSSCLPFLFRTFFGTLERAHDVDDDADVDPKDVPALRFHRFLDLRYCITNSLISLYVVRLAEFIVIWGAKTLGATSDRIACLRSWANCLEYLIFLLVVCNFASLFFQASLPLTFFRGEGRIRQGSQPGKRFALFPSSKRACMRRHNSRPFRYGTNMAIASISPAEHCPTKMANKLVDNSSSVSIISTLANSFFSSSAFFSRSGYVESTVLVHVTKPNL